MPSIQYTKSVTHNIYSDESLTDIMNDIISDMLSLGSDGDLSQMVSSLNNSDESTILDQTVNQDLTHVGENISELDTTDDANNAYAKAIADFNKGMTSYDNGDSLNSQDIMQNNPASDLPAVSDTASNADDLSNDQLTSDTITDVAPEMLENTSTDVPVSILQDIVSTLPVNEPQAPTVLADMSTTSANTSQDVASALPVSTSEVPAVPAASSVPLNAPAAPAMPADLPVAPVNVPFITITTVDNNNLPAGLPILTPMDQTHELVAPMSSLI